MYVHFVLQTSPIYEELDSSDSDVEEEGCIYFNNYQNTVLDLVDEWNFPIFDLADNTDQVLSQVGKYFEKEDIKI